MRKALIAHRSAIGGWLRVQLAAVVAMALVLTTRADADEADRFVVVGGALTEIIYALDRQDRIVAVDTTSLYPPRALNEKPNVGYFRALSAEGVLSVRPSLVVALQGAGPPAAIKSLADAGVRVVTISDAPSPEGVVAKIEALGRVTEATEAAERLVADVSGRFEELAALRAKITKPRRALFVLALQNGRPLVGGRGTAADAIIALAGGENVAVSIEGYKPMTAEAVVAAAPETIVMMSAGAEAATDMFSLPAFATTPAAKERSLFARDGLYLIGFGPRAPDAARELMAAFYPDARVPAFRAASTGARSQDARE
jgi:iron complex transport system substrate-binding protein